MSNEGILLLIATLTLVFSALTFLKSPFRLLWSQWLRYRWYRTVIALREDRTHARVDLPSGIKNAMLLIIHPVRRWHGRPTATERGIERLARCPFYRPHHCVYMRWLPSPQPGCDTNIHCGTLHAQYDPDRPHSRHNRLVRTVRHRPAKKRARRFAETILPCGECGKTSGMVRQKMSWGPDEVRTSPVPVMMFHIEGNRWLCPTCYGVPDGLHDLLPTVD